MPDSISFKSWIGLSRTGSLKGEGGGDNLVIGPFGRFVLGLTEGRTDGAGLFPKPPSSSSSSSSSSLLLGLKGRLPLLLLLFVSFWLSKPWLNFWRPSRRACIFKFSPSESNLLTSSSVNCPAYTWLKILPNTGFCKLNLLAFLNTKLSGLATLKISLSLLSNICLKAALLNSPSVTTWFMESCKLLPKLLVANKYFRKSSLLFIKFIASFWTFGVFKSSI